MTTQVIDERVALAFDDGVLEIRLDRPDKHNALDERMFDALELAIAAAGRQTGLKAVVLTGSGPSFCAGLDLAHYGPRIGKGVFDGLMDRTHADSNKFQHVAMAWRDLPVPVIAVLQGSVFGGGLQIALGADMRFATADAQISVMETRWGLVPDMGGMVLARGLVRPDVWSELVFTARVLSGAEATDVGLVTRLSAAPLEEAHRVARVIAAQSPRAVRAAKRLSNAMADTDRAALLIAESREQLELLQGPDVTEALQARGTRRPPDFQPL